MDKLFLGHKIGGWKLAGYFDGLYYAMIDDKVDFDIKPSKYVRVVMRRIEKAYAMDFIFEKQINLTTLKNRYME
jgi:hypothetical protein